MNRKLLPCEPVVLLHVEHPSGSGLAACCGEPFRAPRDYEFPTVGRQMCPGCFHAIDTGSEDQVDAATDVKRRADELLTAQHLDEALIRLGRLEESVVAASETARRQLNQVCADLRSGRLRVVTR